MDATNQLDENSDSVTVESNARGGARPTAGGRAGTKQEENTCAEVYVAPQRNQNEDSVWMESNARGGARPTAGKPAGTKQERNTCADVYVAPQRNQNEDSVWMESNARGGARPTAGGRAGTKQEENTCAKKHKIYVAPQRNQNEDSVWMESNARGGARPTGAKHVPGVERTSTQHNQVGKVKPFTSQNQFSTEVTPVRLLTYNVLREGMKQRDEKVILDTTTPCLTYTKGWFRNTGRQHEFSFESLNGEDITSYEVIAENVASESITADVVGGGVGMKHIKIQATSHEEGPWNCRIKIYGKDASML